MCKWCDPEMRLTNVVARWPGSTHYWFILRWQGARWIACWNTVNLMSDFFFTYVRSYFHILFKCPSKSCGFPVKHAAAIPLANSHYSVDLWPAFIAKATFCHSNGFFFYSCKLTNDIHITAFVSDKSTSTSLFGWFPACLCHLVSIRTRLLPRPIHIPKKCTIMAVSLLISIACQFTPLFQLPKMFTNRG